MVNVTFVWEKCSMKHSLVLALSVLLTTLVARGQQPAPTKAPLITAVVNAASYDGSLTAGGIVSIFGEYLAPAARAADVIPLPRKLEGTSVSVYDVSDLWNKRIWGDMPLYFVSQNQVNFQLPFEANCGTCLRPLEITVTTANGKSAGYRLAVYPNGPALFSDQDGHPLMFDESFVQVDSIVGGKPTILYSAGLGWTIPVPVTGVAPAVTSRASSPFDLYLGDRKANVTWAGLAPGFVGVYQINAVPAVPISQRVFIRAGYLKGSERFATPPSKVLHATIAPGNNLEDASGSIEILHPNSLSPAMAYSIGFIGAKFSARLNIKASATKFTLAAVTEAGGTIIEFDPQAGTYTADVTVPTPATRSMDFSRADMEPVDFRAGCKADSSQACGSPTPGNIIPASFVSPELRGFLSALPSPNVYPGPGPNTNGIFRVEGTLGVKAKTGWTFAIDETSHPELSTFGGFLPIPIPWGVNQNVTRAEVYIDGRLISSFDGAFKLPQMR
jgi:uncharacterized protein (TIGR03437 family)